MATASSATLNLCIDASTTIAKRQDLYNDLVDALNTEWKANFTDFYDSVQKSYPYFWDGISPGGSKFGDDLSGFKTDTDADFARSGLIDYKVSAIPRLGGSIWHPFRDTQKVLEVFAFSEATERIKDLNVIINQTKLLFKEYERQVRIAAGGFTTVGLPADDPFLLLMEQIEQYEKNGLANYSPGDLNLLYIDIRYIVDKIPSDKKLAFQTARGGIVAGIGGFNPTNYQIAIDKFKTITVSPVVTITDHLGKSSGSSYSFCPAIIENLLRELVNSALVKIAYLNKTLETAATSTTPLSPGAAALVAGAGRAAGAALAASAASALELILADTIIFREQCFLLANIADLAQFKKEEGLLPLPYVTPPAPATGSAPAPKLQNHPIHIQGASFAFTNKLCVHPSQKYLFDVDEATLSSLTPRVKFFKVEKTENGKDVETEIRFDTNVEKDLSYFLNGGYNRGKGGRGLGVGMNSFSFSYDGTDPFSAKKAITAKLSIRASSFSDLLEPRDNGRYKYVDLALKTGKYFKPKKTKKNGEATIILEPQNQDALKAEKENLDKLNFRIRALVEWTAQTKVLGGLSISEKDAIYNSAISVYLTPVIHEFDFDETGAIDFTINYQAYIEDYFANDIFDVFGSITPEKVARDIALDYFRSEDCDITKGDGFKNFKKLDELFISNMNQKSLSTLVFNLRTSNKIKYLNASRKEIKDWLKDPRANAYATKITSSPPTSFTDDIVKAAETAARTADVNPQQSFKLSLIANTDDNPGVAFFYLSDLLSVVMANIENALEKASLPKDTRYFSKVISQLDAATATAISNAIDERAGKTKKTPNGQAELEQFKKMRVVLGPMEITPYGDTKSDIRALSCTIGDIPIGLNYFLDFLSEKILSNDFIQYPFSKFVKDLITDSVKNYINSDSCFNVGGSQKVSLNSTTVLGYNDFKIEDGASTGTYASDQITHRILEDMERGAAASNCLLIDNYVGKKDDKSPEALPIVKISGGRGPSKDMSIDKAINYYIFSIGKRYPVDAYTGNAEQDSLNGIFHYVLGADRGIVKNIRLDKTNTPGLKELRFEQEGYAGLEQLREVYNANISTFLNPQSFPGAYIYVDPKGFDPTAREDLTRFGVGGYFMIVQTSHKIEPGNNETIIDAKWVASKDGNVQRDDTTSSARKETRGDEKQKKCRVRSLIDSAGTR